MAGEAVQSLAQTADIVQYVTYGPIATPADAVFPFVCNDQYVIDEVHVFYTAVGSGGATVQLFRGVTAQNAEDTIAETITAARDITAALDVTTADTEYTRRSMTIQTDNNIIEPGQLVIVDITGTTTSMNLSITMRIRTKSNL